MSLFTKEPRFQVANRIYRGKDPDLGATPLPKTEDFLDKMDSFGDRLKWGAWKGFLVGSFYSLFDISYLTKLGDRRAQILRFSFFTAPAVVGATGYIAALEIAKKYTDTYRGSYAMAAIAPAAIAATWRRDARWFPKAFIPFAFFGMLYANMVENNMNLKFMIDNPNDPYGREYRTEVFGGWPHKATLGPNMKTMQDLGIVPKDPGPTYTKWE